MDSTSVPRTYRSSFSHTEISDLVALLSVIRRRVVDGQPLSLVAYLALLQANLRTASPSHYSLPTLFATPDPALPFYRLEQRVAACS